MMNEPKQQFSPELIDQQTERFLNKLPTRDSRLIADLYQTYTPVSEEYDHSIQHIWSRLVAQAEAQNLPFQHDQKQAASEPRRQGTMESNVGRLDAPIAGSFQRPAQPFPRKLRRSLWRRLSSGTTVAVVLLIILSWVLLTRAVPSQKPQTMAEASLELGGGPQFNNTIIFRVKNSEGNPYLETISFDTYDGHTWSNTAVSRSPLPAGKRSISEGSSMHLVTQQITVVNPPGELQAYIIGTGQIASINQATTVLLNQRTGSQLAMLLNGGQFLTAGSQYTVQSYVSSADGAELRSVYPYAGVPLLHAAYRALNPYPYYNNPAIFRAYLPLLNNLDPRILTKARQVTAGATTMYDMALDLERYLRTSFSYDTNIHPSTGVEPVSWLLFDSGRGFCNYFATAMAVMARELRMPARVVVGYTSGTYDAKAHDWVVRDSDAHAWTQIYFAGYGWINFEPSPGFPLFYRG